MMLRLQWGEHIAGSEEAFVKMMNNKAKELGMKNTNFANTCGLHDDAHVTSAYDIALMSRALITKYPEIHKLATIWTDTITHKTRRGRRNSGLPIPIIYSNGMKEQMVSKQALPVSLCIVYRELPKETV